MQERAGVCGMAGRVDEFRAEEVVETQAAVPLRWRFEDYSPFNPRLPEASPGDHSRNGTIERSKN